MNPRQSTIQHLFKVLKNRPYVLLKHIDRSISDLAASADIDLLMGEREATELIQQIAQWSMVYKLKVIKKAHHWHCFLFLQNDHFLQIDLLFRFVRKEWQYLNEQAVLANAQPNEEGILTMSNKVLFEHLLLFNWLNEAAIGAKYAQYFDQLLDGEQVDILQYLNQSYGLQLKEPAALFDYQAQNRHVLLRTLARQSANRPHRRLLRYAQYLKDTFAAWTSNRGLTISFSGVDGAGKSTVINEVRQRLEHIYRQKVVVLRHRPSVLPILSAYKYGREGASQRSAQRLPRQGNNKSSLSSWIRFMYYYVDYLFGQFYIFFRYTLWGYIILYDRYYFDFIVDGKRSNIQMDSYWPRQLYGLIFKPQLNYFLYAQPEVILQRKQEMPSQDIIQLTDDYKNLFKQLNQKEKNLKRYQAIENTELEKTLHHIFSNYKELQ
ncbi:MAG: hypothetical protein AAFP19_10700 [Bacteroidota bacterium]